MLTVLNSVLSFALPIMLIAPHNYGLWQAMTASAALPKVMLAFFASLLALPLSQPSLGDASALSAACLLRSVACEKLLPSMYRQF